MGFLAIWRTCIDHVIRGRFADGSRILARNGEWHTGIDSGRWSAPEHAGLESATDELAPDADDARHKPGLCPISSPS